MIEENNIPHRRGMIKMKLINDMVEIERSKVICPIASDFIRSAVVVGNEYPRTIDVRTDGIFRGLGCALATKYNWQIVIDDMDVPVLICTKK